MLTRFAAKRYKNVTTEGVTFGRVTLLIGPNGGGKSNLIEAVRFYRDVYAFDGKGSAFHVAVEKRGYGEILKRGEKAPNTIDLSWEHQVGPHRLVVNDWAFQIAESRHFPAGFLITRDTRRTSDPTTDRYVLTRLNDSRSEYQQAARREIAGPEEEKSLPISARNDFLYSGANAEQLAVMKPEELIDLFPALSEPTWWFDEIRGQRFFYGSELSPKLIRSSAKRNLSIVDLNETGSELVNVIANLDRQYKDVLIHYEDRIRQVLPGLSRIRIDDVSDQYKSMSVRIDDEWFRLDELSDGTLKMLAMALLLFSPQKTSLLSIDEPELNLHPAWLRVLAKWMLSAEGPAQVIAGTHSPDLLDAFTEGFKNGDVSVIICDAKKGISNLKPESLQSFFNEGWELGDLYRVGEPLMGGWPW